ncbi:alanine racemase [Clostridium paraputrificum]|uniref:alanine racemase n=1 Tax=Clostridium TaxID=1485 RepID=UPI00232D72DF|nr:MULTISPECIES: alanine racemase [Clostridium]MDB2074979.1 alanine racemase [Clostridium paraputrificum]MDB2078238.1 alanine racemase [Clostridium paraputrificum]MDU1032962.1 alanine racemase [Clostridium sp.]MDU4725646.1 alanine racemase [Clostridium sp.]
MKKEIYKKLLDRKKTPFYVFDKEEFINNYHELENAMKKVYPKYALSYSYKTNYTPYICNLVKTLGGYAEVVSDMEYTLAKKIGYSNDRIVYNGPAKGECLEEHLLNNGIVNIDSVDEAKQIIHIANQHFKHQFKVGIRINLDVGADFISRFGLAPESEDLKNVIDLLSDCKNISVVGLHCHISRNRGIEAWGKRAEIMLNAADKYIKGIPEYISLGSGMFANMADELKKQFNEVPTYEEYAKVTMKPFAEHYKDQMPIVFTEPGTTVVARYINFVTKVLSIKNVRGRKMAVMDGSYLNLGEICTMKKLPVEKLNINDKNDCESIDIMGYTCLEQDLMYENYKGKLMAEDILVFGNVGGYSIVSKPQFIKPNCSMVSVEEDGTIIEIMREETFDDVFSKFVF